MFLSDPSPFAAVIVPFLSSGENFLMNQPSGEKDITQRIDKMEMRQIKSFSKENITITNNESNFSNAKYIHTCTSKPTQKNGT